MHFLKRAVKAVSRRTVKSLLILFILFVIANFVLAGFSIREAVNVAKDSARQQLGATLTLSFDQQAARKKAMSQMQSTQSSSDKRQPFQIETKPVTEDMAKMVAGLEHIIGYNYVVNTSANADGFEPIVQEQEDTSDTTDKTSSKNPASEQQNRPSFTMPDVSVVGVYSSELYASFSSGTYSLVSGSNLLYSADSDKVPVLIEETLAKYNNLSVGSTIKITPVTSQTEDSDSAAKTTSKTYSLTVVGIYSAGTQTGTSQGGFRMDFSQPYNQLFVDYKTALDIKDHTTATSFGGMGKMSSTDGIDSVTYYVDDPLNVDSVVKASTALQIDWDTFILDANSAQYESMIGPINSVGSFATTLVIVVAVAGVIILALILAMWVRERMYETGVLLSLGEGKWKIIGQYVSEVLIVAFFAFTVSIFTGSLVSQKLGDYLLTQQTQAAEEDSSSSNAHGGFGGNRGGKLGFMPGQEGIQTVAAIDDLDVQVDFSTILQLYGFGILLVLVSTAIPSVLVLQYKPRSIFTNAG